MPSKKKPAKRLKKSTRLESTKPLTVVKSGTANPIES